MTVLTYTRTALKGPPALILQHLLRRNLGTFIEKTFNELEPATRYEHNWHIDSIAYHLAEVAAGRCKRLLITMPPRSLKSISASVAFPAWLLGHHPERRVICVSYGRSLTDDLSSKFRKIITARWYRELFPATRIDPRKDTVPEVKTTAGGGRLTTTIGGALTGRGGSLVIVDDPMKAIDANSEAARQSVITWFNETLMTRLDDKRTGAIVVIMQRFHVDDLAGHLLKTGGWTHLNLPAIADEDRTIPVGDDGFYTFRAGELLQPARETQAILDELKTRLGSSAFSAQYLQRPVPAGGNMIDVAWFSRYDRLPETDYRWKTVTSWDTASKADELNDYSVGITALTNKHAFYILNVVRKRLLYPDLKKLIIAERDRWKPDYILIEDKGSGTSLLQDLKDSHVFAKAIEPKGDKVIRLSACTALMESGGVYLPGEAPWLDPFESELLAFPLGVHDDQVDALSQLINWYRTGSRYTLDNVG